MQIGTISFAYFYTCFNFRFEKVKFRITIEVGKKQSVLAQQQKYLSCGCAPSIWDFQMGSMGSNNNSLKPLQVLDKKLDYKKIF